jgi:hypothetical protein
MYHDQMVFHSRASITAFVLALTSCGSPDAGPTVMMDFSRAKGFYDAPFPSLDLQDEEGFFDLSNVPYRVGTPILDSVITLIDEADGAGLSSPIHLRTTVAIDEASLPTLAGSMETTANVFLLDVTEGSPTYLERLPVYVAYVPDTLVYGTTQVISIVPLQGAPMRAHTTYAAVVTTRVRDATGRALVQASEVRALARGRRPHGIDASDAASYRDAITKLATVGTAESDIAGLAVFTTADPGRQIRAVRDDALAHLPSPNAAFSQIEIFDDYCVFETTIDMPDYQAGTPPFTTAGGGWAFDAQGAPVLQRLEPARIFVTLPRTAVPANGFPTAVFVRTGGGGDRPLIDRGPRATNGGATITPGSGPAMHFAEAGFAGVSIDGPHGGLRNVTNGDEQFLIFNITNPLALRDNIRQSVVELTLLPHVLEHVTIDASACPGVTGATTAVTLDLTHLTIMGHSMGATFAPIVAAHEPAYRALLLSGAGGSYIENILYKQKPFPTAKFFGSIIQYSGAAVTRHDIALGFFQWANDSADPLSFLRLLSSEPGPSGPVHVLMMQGIVDHYIMPTIANATSLGLGLELAGPALDGQTPEIAEFTPLAALLPLVGGGTTTLPASGNVAGPGGAGVTAVVTQHAEDGIEDGHEVVFQTEEPKHEYACFLYAYRTTGTPRVPAPGVDAMCP